jgi:hypothetical protein
MTAKTLISILFLSLCMVGVGLLLGPMSQVAYATACNKTGNCTYYYTDNSTAKGSCGQYDNVSCTCDAGNDSQSQSACNLVQ